MLNHIKSNDNHWTVVLNGQPHQFDHTHPEYSSLVDSVMNGDEDSFVEMLNTGTVIEDWSEGNFEMRDGFLYYEDERVATQPTERIVGLIKQGYDHKPMLTYLDNLYKNVSNRAVMESYNWCSHKGLPITEDGMLIGYKGVKLHTGGDTTDKHGRTISDGDHVDKYTGNSFRNNIGDVCEMNRRKVSDDCGQGCAAGLHVGTYDYANDWAGSTGVVVLVKFDPADIVSVPTDCDHKKMRVSKYEVVSIAREQLEEEVYDYDADIEAMYNLLRGWDI
tara:strand:+ start:232 stop:1059 length:828 start_codon:yes stop_codon:yes gene_type:complete